MTHVNCMYVQVRPSELKNGSAEQGGRGISGYLGAKLGPKHFRDGAEKLPVPWHWWHSLDGRPCIYVIVIPK